MYEQRLSPTRWRFKSNTDQSEQWHYVELLARRLYCTCAGFVNHKKCKHVSLVKETYDVVIDEEYPPTTAVATRQHDYGLAVNRTPQELRVRLAEMKVERELVHEFMKDVMVPSTFDAKGVCKLDGDYGVIPGTDKPTLLKPGAEKLAELYGYAPTIKSRDEMIDNESGHYRVVVTMALVQKGSGVIVAEGVGECNTREARYFYRWMPEWELRKIPELWELRETYKSQDFEYTPRTGQNAGRRQTAKRYRVENDDLFTLWNTVLKMAKKRALVDVVMSATRSSGVFTQSADSLNDWIEAEFSVTDEPPPAQPATSTTLTASTSGTRSRGASAAPPSPPAAQTGSLAETIDKIGKLMLDTKNQWPTDWLRNWTQLNDRFGWKGDGLAYKKLDAADAAECLRMLRSMRGEAEPEDIGTTNEHANKDEAAAEAEAEAAEETSVEEDEDQTDSPPAPVSA